MKPQKHDHPWSRDFHKSAEQAMAREARAHINNSPTGWHTVLCLRCGEKAVPGTNLCDKHLEEK